MNMNYFSFYNKAKELLIDSLASLWFKGQAQEQEYIKRILTKDEPLLQNLYSNQYSLGRRVPTVLRNILLNSDC